MWANHTGAFAILQSLDDGDAMAKYSVVEESMVKDPTNASVWTHLFGDYVRGVVWDTLAWTWSAEIDWTIQRDAATSEAEKETFITAALQGAGVSKAHRQEKNIGACQSDKKRHICFCHMKKSEKKGLPVRGCGEEA